MIKKLPTNDILLRIMQNTYLFRIHEIDMLLTELFFRYMNLLDYINSNLKANVEKSPELFEKIEAARSIIYFIGYFYCEIFGVGAIERRLNAYNIDSLRFYEIIDRGGTFNLEYLDSTQTRYFKKIIEFYKILKKWKNLIIPGYRLYFAEDYYNETRRKLET